MNKNLAIIILTWNDFENTIKCIKSAVNSLRKNDKIFIIDNHSKKIILDKTISWISKNYYKKFQNKIYEKPVLFPVNTIKNKSIFLIFTYIKCADDQEVPLIRHKKLFLLFIFIWRMGY